MYAGEVQALSSCIVPMVSRAFCLLSNLEGIHLGVLATQQPEFVAWAHSLTETQTNAAALHPSQWLKP